jgi:hypothetical protein
MTTSTLFSGADISGRDELFTRGPSSSVLDGFFEEVFDEVERIRGLLVGRAATTITIAAVALTSTFGSVPGASVEFPEVAWVLRDEVAQRIRSASSQSTQPNEAARSNALFALCALRSCDLEPHRVIGDPDGGIAMYIFGGRTLVNGGHSKFARLLATNEGDIIAMCADDAVDRPGIWAADRSEMAKTVSRIQSFISG